MLIYSRFKVSVVHVFVGVFLCSLLLYNVALMKNNLSVFLFISHASVHNYKLYTSWSHRRAEILSERVKYPWKELEATSANFANLKNF